MKKKNKMEKCKTCINRDKEKSNENWVVCGVTKSIDMDVILSGSSENCKNFKEDKMYKLKVGKKGLLNAVELEKGSDIVAGYVERDIHE